MTEIASELKYHMQRQHVSARELARQSGVKSSFIYDVLSGKSGNPSTIKLAKVARVLGVSLSQLVEPNTGQHIPDISIVSSQAFDDMVTPPLLNPARSHLAHQPPFSFSKRWLKQLCAYAEGANALAGLVVSGDAMSPTLLANDYVLIDQMQNRPFPPGLFVIRQDQLFDIRRLEYVHGTESKRVRVIADHDHYSHYEVTLDSLDIVGRIVWHARSFT